MPDLSPISARKISLAAYARLWSFEVDLAAQESEDETPLDDISCRQLRNLFEPVALEAVARDMFSPIEPVALAARTFLVMHESLLGIICKNPNCLELIENKNAGRGHRKWFHHPDCEGLVKARDFRRRKAVDTEKGWSARPWRDDDRPLSAAQVTATRSALRKGLEKFIAARGLASRVKPAHWRAIWFAFKVCGLAGVDQYLSGKFNIAPWTPTSSKPKRNRQRSTAGRVDGSVTIDEGTTDAPATRPWVATSGSAPWRALQRLQGASPNAYARPPLIKNDLAADEQFDETPARNVKVQ